MTREAYRSLFGDLTKLKDSSLLNDPAAGTGDDNELFQLLMAVSETVERFLNLQVVPLTRTRNLDVESARPSILVPELISVTTLKTDDNQDGVYETTWAATDYKLLPLDADPTQHWGRPYDEIAVSSRNDATKTEFPAGDRVVELSGVFGLRQLKEDSGSNVTDNPLSATAATMNVTAGADFAIGQTVIAESEQMLITNIVTNALTVRRGLNGTTAASHALNTDVFILRWPSPVERATLIQTARIWSRAPFFEPFYVDSDLDTDVRWMLETYRKLEVAL